MDHSTEGSHIKLRYILQADNHTFSRARTLHIAFFITSQITERRPSDDWGPSLIGHDEVEELAAFEAVLLLSRRLRMLVHTRKLSLRS